MCRDDPYGSRCACNGIVARYDNLVNSSPVRVLSACSCAFAESREEKIQTKEKNDLKLINTDY
jgi:hypothetical protein